MVGCKNRSKPAEQCNRLLLVGGLLCFVFEHPFRRDGSIGAIGFVALEQRAKVSWTLCGRPSHGLGLERRSGSFSVQLEE